MSCTPILLISVSIPVYSLPLHPSSLKENKNKNKQSEAKKMSHSGSCSFGSVGLALSQVPAEFIDEVDVDMGQLKAPNLGLGGSWLGKLSHPPTTKVSSLALPGLAYPAQHPSRGRCSSSALRPLGQANFSWPSARWLAPMPPETSLLCCPGEMQDLISHVLQWVRGRAWSLILMA